MDDVERKALANIRENLARCEKLVLETREELAEAQRLFGIDE